MTITCADKERHMNSATVNRDAAISQNHPEEILMFNPYDKKFHPIAFGWRPFSKPELAHLVRINCPICGELHGHGMTVGEKKTHRCRHCSSDKRKPGQPNGYYIHLLPKRP